MRHILLAAALLFAGPAAALAQDAAVDSVKEAAARQLIARTHAIDQALRVMEAGIPAQREAMPNIPPEFWDRFMKRARETRGDFERRIVAIYARAYTLDEIRQLIAFYDTPIGQRLVELQPTLMQESMHAGEEWGRQLGVAVGQEMVAEQQSTAKP